MSFDAAFVWANSLIETARTVDHRRIHDARDFLSLLHADTLDRPEHEWSSVSPAGDNHCVICAGERLRNFGAAARATLATLPDGAIRRLVAKLVHVRLCPVCFD